MSSKYIKSGRKTLQVNTLATDELLCLKNAGTQISMFFISNEKSALMVIEKIKILWAILELPPRQHCQSSPVTSKMDQMS
jgi:hypothetical protein